MASPSALRSMNEYGCSALGLPMTSSKSRSASALPASTLQPGDPGQDFPPADLCLELAHPDLVLLGLKLLVFGFKESGLVLELLKLNSFQLER